MSNLANWEISDFKIIADFTISITFKDGKKQTINFEPVIGKGWMKQLKDKEYFARVVLNDGGNLEWPDGQDFNPEALYDWPKFEKLYIQDMEQMKE